MQTKTRSLVLFHGLILILPAFALAASSSVADVTQALANRLASLYGQSLKGTTADGRTCTAGLSGVAGENFSASVSVYNESGTGISSKDFYIANTSNPVYTVESFKNASSLIQVTASNKGTPADSSWVSDVFSGLSSSRSSMQISVGAQGEIQQVSVTQNQGMATDLAVGKTFTCNF